MALFPDDPDDYDGRFPRVVSPFGVVQDAPTLPPADAEGLDLDDGVLWTKRETLLRLQRAIPKAIRALELALLDHDTPNTIKAAIALLDRAGYGPKSTLQIEELPDDLSTLTTAEIAARFDELGRAAAKLKQSTD